MAKTKQTCKTCKFWVTKADYPLRNQIIGDGTKYRHCTKKRLVKNHTGEEVNIWYTAHFHRACELWEEAGQLTIFNND